MTVVCSVLPFCCVCGSACCCKLLGLDLQQFYRQIPFQILFNFPSEISAGSYGSTGIMMSNECK